MDALLGRELQPRRSGLQSPPHSRSDAKSSLRSGHGALALFWCFLIPESTSRSTGSRLKFGHPLADTPGIPMSPPPRHGPSGAWAALGFRGFSLLCCQSPEPHLPTYLKKEKKRLQDHLRISYVIKICLIAFSPGEKEAFWAILLPPASCKNEPHFHGGSPPGLPGLGAHD